MNTAGKAYVVRDADSDIPSGDVTQLYAYTLKGLTTALTVLLAITGLVALFAAFALFHRASVVNDFTGFGSVSVHNEVG